MITSASIVSQSPPPAPQASSPPPDSGSGQGFSDVLSQTQSAQRPANDPPAASAGSTPPAAKTDGKGSAKADGKTGKKVDVKKSDDSTEKDSDADPADVAIPASLPGDDSTDGHPSDAKPQEKGTKSKATDVTAAPHPNDSQTTVPIQVGPDAKVKAPASGKDSTAKDPASQGVKVVAADDASTPPPATVADQTSPSADSPQGTDPTASAEPAKGGPGAAKSHKGKTSPADPTVSDSGIDPSSAVASAAVGAVTDDPAESDSAASDTAANNGSIAPAEHAAATNVASLTADSFATPIVSNSSAPHSLSGSTFVLPTPAAEPSAEAQFGQTNYPQIVSAVHGQLLPGGGSMQIRLDPPELGAVHINVQMRDGAMTATFEASNEQAARLLSHSLGDLKTSLESQGVNVEAIHVKQSTTTSPTRSSSQDSQQQQNSSDNGNARREEQRQQMIRRMWKRLSGGDPLDMVA